MSDSISRKPPSIFTGDKGKGGAGGGNGKGRNSGIFRFGKAIAAAFNPFGIWGGSGSGSGSGSGGQDDGRGITKEDAERAYEELKKAGFKGTQKGSYTQQQQQQQQRNSVDSCAADQTWRAVQEKMAGRHSSHDSSGSSQSIATPRRDSGMFRSSWQDLRRAKSTLGIPYSRRHDSQGSSASAVSEGGEVRRQRSKKEMQKQAKLIKKVSNLEEKLGKARKELRELEGDDDEEQQPKTLCLESTYPRKFVPGALPTLPSERLLDRQTLSASPEPLPGSTSYTLFPRVPEKEEEFHDLSANKQRPKTPKKAQSLAPDSSPRKRKSPDPGSKGTDQRDDKIEPSRTPSRKSKFHKTGKADSPTSAALKQTQGQHKTAFQQHRRASPPPKRTSRSSPGTPQLRMRKAQDDLRAAIASKSGQEGLSPSPARGETPTVDGDGVPPVPPIPKDLAAAVPEVKRQGEKSGEEDEFNWPAECF